MTTSEFSDQFDVLYNNITSNQAPGLNEYEKSVFLTKAQEELVKNYFSPKGNPKQDGFDDSPKRQADFANIISTSTLSTVDASKFDQRSLAYKAPSDMFICLNEQLMDGSIPLTVMPISYSEYDRLMAKPYKYPPKYQAWRLTTNNASINNSIDTASGVLGNYTCITASNYGKPVRFIVRATAGASVAPSIEETSSLVTITCVVGKTIDDGAGGQRAVQDTRAYWTKYLYGSNFVLSPYLIPFEGGDNKGNWPSIVINESWTDAPMFDIINSGGTPGGIGTIFEVIGRFSNTPSYRMRYIRRPNPIILVNLSGIQNGLTIQNRTAAMTSELSEELHEEILQRAVELAKIAWAGDPAAIIQTGQRSE